MPHAVQHTIGHKHQVFGLGFQRLLGNHTQHIILATVQGNYRGGIGRDFAHGHRVFRHNVAGIQSVCITSIQRQKENVWFRTEHLDLCISHCAQAGRINAATGKSDIEIGIGGKAVKAIDCRFHRIGWSAHIRSSIATCCVCEDDVCIQRQIGSEWVKTGKSPDLGRTLTLIRDGITAATTGRQCQGHCRRQYFLIDMHGFSQTVCYLFYFCLRRNLP